jgi:hypothetical protein
MCRGGSWTSVTSFAQRLAGVGRRRSLCRWYHGFRLPCAASGPSGRWRPAATFARPAGLRRRWASRADPVHTGWAGLRGGGARRHAHTCGRLRHGCGVRDACLPAGLVLAADSGRRRRVPCLPPTLPVGQALKSLPRRLLIAACHKRGFGAAGGEQGLEESLGREAARVEDQREESRVVDVDAVERFHPRSLAVVVLLERLLGTAAVNDVLALIGRDALLERRPQADVNRRGMLR